MSDKRFINIRTTYHKMCSLARKSFLFENDDAINKRFTNRVTQSVLGNTKPSLSRTALESSGRTKRIGLRNSYYGPSNLVSKSLVLQSPERQ